MQLSEHFTLEELIKSETADRWGIDNTPNTQQITNLKLVCINILEPVRKFFGVPIKPSSGFRCLEVNTKINGSKTSSHLMAQAVDFEIAGISNYVLATWIAENLEFDQVILECYTKGQPNSGWVHVGYKRNGNRNSILTYSNKEYTKGLFE